MKALDIGYLSLVGPPKVLRMDEQSFKNEGFVEWLRNRRVQVELVCKESHHSNGT